MTLIHLLGLFITAALSVISVILLVNLRTFPRLGTVKRWDEALPRVSILIPARNEGAVIREVVQSLASQDYPYFEVIVLDDNSTDNTGELARSASRKVTVLKGSELPIGWTGKNWACHQLSQAATGEILVFTDADVRWAAGSVSALVNQLLRTEADLLTIWPTQTTITWGERLTVPLMAMVILAYLPVWGVHHLPWAIFGAANGQCMAWRRGVYQKMGGHEAVKSTVLDDVTQARMVKAAGLRLRMADGAGLMGCRMYQDWDSVLKGYAKNILAGYGGVVPLVLATLFHWLIFLFPWVWLFLGGGIWAGILVCLGIGIRAVTAGWTRQRPLDAFLMPVSVLLMTAIAAKSLYWQWRYGGPVWKGRVIRRAEAKL